VELVLEVEDAFALRIPDAEAQKIRTVGDLVGFVRARASNQPKSLTDEEIAQKVRQIISTQLGVPMHQLTDGTRFVEDLGVD
jgi:acyl carrier protein